MDKISQTLEQSETAQPLRNDLRARILGEAARLESKALPPHPSSPRRLSAVLVGTLCLAVAIGAFVTISPMARRSLLSGEASSTVGLLERAATVSEQQQAQGLTKMRTLGPNAGYAPAKNSVQHSVAPDVYQTSGGLAGEEPSLSRQVHREASLTLTMSDPESTSDQIEKKVKDCGGYVASNSLTTDETGLKSAQMTVNVPVAQFDTFLGEIEKMGSVLEKNVTGEDITGKVSDANTTESVLETEVAQSNEHLAALGRHATWEDEENARELRIEMAEARARIQLLDKLAALAEVTITLNQTPKPAPPVQTGMAGELRGNSAAAFQSMLGTITAVITFLIWVAAYVPVWGPIGFAAWYASRHRLDTTRSPHP